MRQRCPLFALSTLMLVASCWGDAGAVDFREQVAPILQRRCLGCHNDASKKGDFSLQTATSAMAGGHITPGDAEGSRLLEVLVPVDGRAEMPKDGDPLEQAERAILRDWVQSGALWPGEFELSTSTAADMNWWSLLPLSRPEVPECNDPRSKNPIDAFILSALAEKRLVPNEPADRATLVRRLYFDLIGLPPTPKQVRQFVEDPDSLAYEHLVDELLDSHHYGERWARHWLDVAHYADTHGYDKDKLRPNAWPYRDYVIRALNSDKPYHRFVMEQIAGDVLWPETQDGITATGFIAAGPWDFIGHAEVPETKIDGKIARHLDRDDMVSSTMNTFVSTTVQCARCHDHKFDPVSQEHYYSLHAVFAALDRADRPYDLSPDVATQRAQLLAQKSDLERQLESLEKSIRDAAGQPLVDVETELRALEAQRKDGEQRPEYGFHSEIEDQPDHVKWVQVDLGSPTQIEELTIIGAYDETNGIGHGFGFPVRFKIELSDDPKFESSVQVVADRTGDDGENPGTKPQTFSVNASKKLRYVRITATKLAHRNNDYIFALGELQVMSGGDNVARGKPVTSLDSIEAPVRWQRKNLVDGYHYGMDEPPGLLAEIKAVRNRQQALVQRSTSDLMVANRTAWKTQLAETKRALDSLPDQELVYAGTIHTGKGAFKGTGANGGRPREIHILNRGNILQPRDPVGPGTIPVVPELDWKFALPEDHREGQRRAALAEWIVRSDNPLTWRSIVNRVWQYHFGRGIVDSPNDFGRMGQQPSHPQLLDWLAVEFRDGGQSLKRLHKLIVTSATYRQSSAHHESNSELDADNRFLWRMNRKRLEAEEVRDAVLAVSGKLDRTMYGPGMRLFALERAEHSPHYEYHKHDPDDPKSHRRGIYRFVVRSQPDPFMTTLDCADSSQSVAKRDETVTPLQALSLLNNKFMVRMAEHFAERVKKEASGLGEQVERAFALSTGHKPTRRQRDDLVTFASEFGLQSTCRMMFNLNEFVFVD